MTDTFRAANAMLDLAAAYPKMYEALRPGSGGGPRDSIRRVRFGSRAPISAAVSDGITGVEHAAWSMHLAVATSVGSRVTDGKRAAGGEPDPAVTRILLWTSWAVEDVTDEVLLGQVSLEAEVALEMAYTLTGDRAAVEPQTPPCSSCGELSVVRRLGSTQTWCINPLCLSVA